MYLELCEEPFICDMLFFPCKTGSSGCADFPLKKHGFAQLMGLALDVPLPSRAAEDKPAGQKGEGWGEWAGRLLTLSLNIHRTSLLHHYRLELWPVSCLETYDLSAHGNHLQQLRSSGI